MITSPQFPTRTYIATALTALALLGGAFGVAKTASAAAPAAPEHPALVSDRHGAHVDVATIRGDLERLGVEDGPVRRQARI